MTQAQSEEIIGVGELVDIVELDLAEPVEGLIAQTVFQVLLRRVVGPLRRLVLRQGGAEGADLSGQTGVVEEQRFDV